MKIAESKKSWITNGVALALMGVGAVAPGAEIIFSMGLFAFSGAITNWLAIHMLFEKVPFLYGSGVIPNRFEDFKLGIKGLIMGEFFNRENVQQFFESELGTVMEGKSFDLSPLVQLVDLDKIFDDLVSVILSSSFGGMLNMMGGVQALTPLREPFRVKMAETFSDILQDQKFKEKVQEMIAAQGQKELAVEGIIEKVEAIVVKRLNELTPQKVKQLIQDMIALHLGWLVVWGGVFGGLIGLISGLLR